MMAWRDEESLNGDVSRDRSDSRVSKTSHEEGHHHLDPVQTKKRVHQHFANVLKGFIGSNYLSVPFTFAAFGEILGPIMIFLIAGLNGFGCLLLIKIRKILVAQGRKSDTYGEVTGQILGPWGHAFVEFFLALTQWGWCIGYTIYIHTAIDQFTRNSLSSATIIYLILTPAFILLCSVPDLKHFIPFSSASNLALLVGFFAILSLAIQNIYQIQQFLFTYEVNPVESALSFGNLVSSFEGIGTVLSVEGSMAKDHVRQYYPRLLSMTLFAISSLFSVFGIVGYAGFGKGLCSVILTNLPPGILSDIARIALVIGLFFTYGFQMFPILEAIDMKLSANTNNTGTRCQHHHHQIQQQDEEDEGHEHIVHEGYGALESPPPTTPPHGPDAAHAASNSSPTEEKGVGLFNTFKNLKGLDPKHVLRYVGVRILIVFFASSVAFFLPSFELIIALIGSLGASTLAFIIPGILAFVFLPSSPMDRAMYIFSILFGVIGGGIGTYYALKDIVSGTSQC